MPLLFPLWTTSWPTSPPLIEHSPAMGVNRSTFSISWHRDCDRIEGQYSSIPYPPISLMICDERSRSSFVSKELYSKANLCRGDINNCEALKSWKFLITIYNYIYNSEDNEDFRWASERSSPLKCILIYLGSILWPLNSNSGQFLYAFLRKNISPFTIFVMSLQLNIEILRWTKKWFQLHDFLSVSRWYVYMCEA